MINSYYSICDHWYVSLFHNRRKRQYCTDNIIKRLGNTHTHNLMELNDDLITIND